LYNTRVVYQRIELSKLGLHFFERASDGLVRLDVNLHWEELAARRGELLFSSADRVLGLGERSPADNDGVGLIGTTEGPDNLKANAGVGARDEDDL
jgi:hypothetical protein